jgi:hypothetical protein
MKQEEDGMPSEAEINAERERLYESASLREDINDDEATVLLQWGEDQVRRLAGQSGADFEQQSRFLRQLIKHINRFVGQREFEDEAGQAQYLSKVVTWLDKLGYPAYTVEEMLAAMPADKMDMMGTLRAVLTLLSPTTSPTGLLPAIGEGEHDEEEPE